MTYLPDLGAASPSAASRVPGQPVVPGPAGQPPARQRAWRETADRLRTAATTEPGRLRIIGAALALLVVAFGSATAWEVADRFASAQDVVSRSQPLSADAANIYRSLADADTAAAGGFLAGANEPASVRQRYQQDVRTASQLLINAASNTEADSESGRQIATINEQLPRYTGLIERARANNRQGLPLGGAYLRYANQQMTVTLLPAAERLYAAETDRLGRDNDNARLWPFIALATGLLVMGVLIWVQRRNYLRTNRVFNHGLLAATAASTALLLWLIVGQSVARTDLGNAQAHGQDSLAVLNDARINSLKARANENLTLVARGSVLTSTGRDQYETDYTRGMSQLRKSLGEAAELADDSAGGTPVEAALASVHQWQDRHKSASSTDKAGDYDGALRLVIGTEGSTGQSFDQVDQELKRAIDHEQREFTHSVEDGRSALNGLAIGAGALALLAAVGAILGMGRRLSEYR